MFANRVLFSSSILCLSSSSKLSAVDAGAVVGCMGNEAVVVVAYPVWLSASERALRCVKAEIRARFLCAGKPDGEFVSVGAVGGLDGKRSLTSPTLPNERAPAGGSCGRPGCCPCCGRSGGASSLSDERSMSKRVPVRAIAATCDSASSMAVEWRMEAERAGVRAASCRLAVAGVYGSIGRAEAQPRRATRARISALKPAVVGSC
jgi:hypothetical protein